MFLLTSFHVYNQYDISKVYSKVNMILRIQFYVIFIDFLKISFWASFFLAKTSVGFNSLACNTYHMTGRKLHYHYKNIYYLRQVDSLPCHILQLIEDSNHII